MLNLINPRDFRLADRELAESGGKPDPLNTLYYVTGRIMTGNYKKHVDGPITRVQVDLEPLDLTRRLPPAKRQLFQKRVTDTLEMAGWEKAEFDPDLSGINLTTHTD